MVVVGKKQNDELSRYMLQNRADGFPAAKSEVRGACLLYIYNFYFSTQLPDFISLYTLFSKKLFRIQRLTILSAANEREVLYFNS